MLIDQKLEELRNEFKNTKNEKHRSTLELQAKVLKLGLNAKPFLPNLYAKPWPRPSLEDNVKESLL